MPSPTPILGLQAATPTDDLPAYLTAATGSLAESLGAIDDLFSEVTGHRHSGTAQGGLIAVPTLLHEEFLPAAAATDITLSQTPTVVLVVARDGMIQSETDLHYSLTAAVLTFVTPFTGAERVVVAYGASV